MVKNCQHCNVVQRGPQGSKMVNLDVFDNLGPFWTRLDPFGMLKSLTCLAIFVCFIGAFFWDTLYVVDH